MTVTTDTQPTARMQVHVMTGTQVQRTLGMLGLEGRELSQALAGVRQDWAFYRERQAKERRFADTHWFDRERDGCAIWRKHVRRAVARAVAAKKALGVYRQNPSRMAVAA